MKNGAFLNALLDLNYSKNYNDGWEIDTLGTTSFRTNLRNHGDGSVWNVQGQFGFSKDISKVSTIRRIMNSTTGTSGRNNGRSISSTIRWEYSTC